MPPFKNWDYFVTRLIRVEIHGEDGKFLKGGVGNILYDSHAWESICKEMGIDPEEAEDKALSYELLYPDLPPDSYTFWFTEEGYKDFEAHHGLLIALAGAIWENGKVVIRFRPYYRDENLIYEDNKQVVYRNAATETATI